MVEFEDWYQHYPRKVARGQAEQAFAKARRAGERLETLIAGAKRYSAQVAGKEPRYVRYPATWLNGKCWLDEPEPPAGAGSDGKLTWWQRRELEEHIAEERALGG